MSADNDGHSLPKITHPQYAGHSSGEYLIVRGKAGKFSVGDLRTAHIGTVSKETTTMPAADSPSREEVNAKMEAVEARLDGKLASIDGKLDRLFDRMEVVVRASERAETAADQARQSASNVKWNIFFTALGVIATLFAAWTLWAEGIEMITGIFSSGAEVSQ